MPGNSSVGRTSQAKKFSFQITGGSTPNQNIIKKKQKNLIQKIMLKNRKDEDSSNTPKINIKGQNLGNIQKSTFS